MVTRAGTHAAVPLFDPAAAETRRGLRLAAAPPPERGYFIAFTARSGSSWLCDLLASAGTLGRPGEAFNPRMVPNASRALGARDLETYVDRQLRLRQSGGTFGVKLTSAHAETVFGSLDAFLDRCAGHAAVFLVREDIVAQAVSSYLMRFQSFGHAIEGNEVDRVESAPYDGRILRKIVKRFLAQEEAWEQAFAGRGLRPLRLSQERMLAADPRALVARIAAHVGAEVGEDVQPQSSHRKIGTGLNAEFAARFRESNAPFVAKIACARAARLDSVAP